VTGADRHPPAPARGAGPGAASQRDLWTARTVAWYERANARSDYAARVLAVLGPLVGECRSALDVGAGFGALAVPLARRLEQVTAVEPAPAMAAALRRAAARQRLGNLTVVEAAWGEVAVPPHDLVLCAHVGPLLRDPAFLGGLGAIARRGAALVHSAPGGDDKFFFGELYPRLCGRPYESGRPPRDPGRILGELGVHVQATTVEYRSDQPFESLDEACDFWTTYLGRDDAETRAFLRSFLPARLRREGRLWIAPYRARAVVLQWRTGPAPAGDEAGARYRTD
jgi:SAM-dependent methyltransferase